jgi:hypothetical protein
VGRVTVTDPEELEPRLPVQGGDESVTSAAGPRSTAPPATTRTR